jgi:hypothetical protein
LVRRHAGVGGLVQLRQALKMMDGGAESLRETRMRLLLVRSGLPKPETQIVVMDGFRLSIRTHRHGLSRVEGRY